MSYYVVISTTHCSDGFVKMMHSKKCWIGAKTTLTSLIKPSPVWTQMLWCNCLIRRWSECPQIPWWNLCGRRRQTGTPVWDLFEEPWRYWFIFWLWLGWFGILNFRRHIFIVLYLLYCCIKNDIPWLGVGTWIFRNHCVSHLFPRSPNAATLWANNNLSTKIELQDQFCQSA